MVPGLINGRAFDARKPRASRRMRAKLRSRVLATTNTVVVDYRSGVVTHYPESSPLSST